MADFKLLKSNDFAKALVDAGVIDGDLDKMERIVIVAEAGQLVKIHVRYAAEDNLLPAALGMEGAVVTESQEKHSNRPSK